MKVVIGYFWGITCRGKDNRAFIYHPHSSLLCCHRHRAPEHCPGLNHSFSKTFTFLKYLPVLVFSHVQFQWFLHLFFFFLIHYGIQNPIRTKKELYREVTRDRSWGQRSQVKSDVGWNPISMDHHIIIAAQPWGNHLTFLSLSFSSIKWRVMAITLLD